MGVGVVVGVTVGEWVCVCTQTWLWGIDSSETEANSISGNEGMLMSVEPAGGNCL